MNQSPLSNKHIRSPILWVEAKIQSTISTLEEIFNIERYKSKSNEQLVYSTSRQDLGH